MNTIDLIKGCALFSELSADSARGLARCASKKKCEEGDVIFSEGDPARALYILIGGSVELIKSSPEGKEQFVRRVGPGETFAEAAMFAGEAYPVTAIARVASELLVIGKSNFVAFVRSNPEVALKIIGAMARLLRHLNSMLSEQTLSSVQTRLAAYLVKMARTRDSKSFDLGIEKRELAFRLGTIPATISRNLKKFKENGLIEVQGHKIIIRNIKQLEELSAN